MITNLTVLFEQADDYMVGIFDITNGPPCLDNQIVVQSCKPGECIRIKVPGRKMNTVLRFRKSGMRPIEIEQELNSLNQTIDLREEEHIDDFWYYGLKKPWWKFW